MQLIDFHTHAFPDDLAQRAVEGLMSQAPLMKNVLDGTFYALQQSMLQAGVAKSVVLPVSTKPSQVEGINAAAAKLDRESFIPFGTLHPADTDYIKRIEFLKAHNIPGIKLHPEFQDFLADDASMFPVYDALQQAGIIVVFHAGFDPGPFTNDHSQPSSLKRIAHNFPKLIMVAAHMGGMEMWDEVEHDLVGTNVYFDTSAATSSIAAEQFMRIVNKHGSEKILFGSDSPWFGQAESIAWIDRRALSSAQKEQIMGKNAQDLLRPVFSQKTDCPS